MELFLIAKKMDIITSVFGFFYLPELIGKYIGALFVDLYMWVRRKNAEGSYAWLFPMAIAATLNACVAQPLFFASNIVLHARGVIDGIGTALYGCFTGKPKTIWAGIKGLFRGIACLAIDALAIGVMAGVAIGCSLIFQPHVALGLVPLIANVHSAAIGSIAAQAVISAGAGLAVPTASIMTRVTASASLSSTSSCMQSLGTQQNMKARDKTTNPESAFPMSEKVVTTAFGFRPRTEVAARVTLLEDGDDSLSLSR